MVKVGRDFKAPVLVKPIRWNGYLWVDIGEVVLRQSDGTEVAHIPIGQVVSSHDRLTIEFSFDLNDGGVEEGASDGER